jgi:hypothetical protein
MTAVAAGEIDAYRNLDPKSMLEETKQGQAIVPPEVARIMREENLFREAPSHRFPAEAGGEASHA